jgi:pimeloyl-ACP methyl ester carboxylesterase
VSAGSAAGVLRTDDARFAALPGYPWAPHYADIAGMRMHYVDVGPRDAEVTALCLHGQPSWSYLYRKMIPIFTAAGLRVVAPDLFGFGRSDKPQDEAWYSFDSHRDALLQFVEQMDLRKVLLVVQDWGGILGLTLPMVRPERYTRLLVMNTALGLGTVSEGFRQWRAYSNSQPDMAIGKLFQRGNPELTPQEIAAYDAPFPDARYKAGVRRFPNLVPDQPAAPGAEISRQAARFWSEQWQGDSFMVIGMQDPVLGPPVMLALRKLIRGCPEPLEVADGGHFVQERGELIAAAALRRFGLAQA